MNNRIDGKKRVKLIKLFKKAVTEQKTPERIFRYFKYINMAKKHGVVDFRWDRIATEYCYDDFEYPDVSQELKKHLHEQGYTSNKIAWFGMTKENMRDYLSDFELYNVKAYVNRKGVLWFDDKLNTYYLLKPFSSNIPRHYYWVKGNEAYPLDVPDKAVCDKLSAVVKIMTEHPLAVKACKGGHGEGFFKLEKRDDAYFINNKTVTKDNMFEVISKLDNYIITEYIYPHDVFVDLCGKDAYTVIRILVVFDKNDGPQITSANIRLGCKAAGVVTGYAGCIYAGVDLTEGTLFNPLYRPYDHEYKHEKCEIHPDTGKRISGTRIPDFDQLKTLVNSISEYIPFAPYLMMDIIPSNKGYYVLEINSHGQPITMEPYYPFRKNQYNRRVLNLKDE